MKEQFKIKLATILGVLLKDIIIGIIVSCIIGTILCVIFGDFSINTYVKALIGGFIGSLLSDIRFFNKR